MAPTQDMPRAGLRLPAAGAAFWPLAGVILALALHLGTALQRAVNWDEFWHYSQIHALRDGTLIQPLQTLYTRVFLWVIDLPGTGVDHIVILRLFMFGCLLAICASIHAMALRFADRGTAWLCVLIYLTGGYVLHHGTSFRFDPMAGALLMGSLAIMLRSRLNSWFILATAALAAIALVLTIKSVLYAPAFAGVAWLRWQEAENRNAMLARLAALAVATGLIGAAVFFLHSHTLGQAEVVDAKAKFGLLNSQQKMFGFGNLPYYSVIPRAAVLAPLAAICVLLTPAILLKRTAQGPAGAERVALWGLWLPITVLAFYHNSAPYFYVFILPPVLVAAVVAVPVLTRRYSLAALSLTTIAIACGIWAVDDHSGTQGRQRSLLEAADRMFPHPVNYFDLAGMLGRHHKQNAFMTPWGTELYLAGDTPSMRDTMEREPVPLVLDNDPMFTNALHGLPDPHFLPQDAAALRDNYLPFWGPFWLAGKAVRADGADHAEEFLVPGAYTVEDAPVRIDGQDYRAGEIATIARGRHELRAAGDTDARLIWGTRLARPADSPPPEPYWTSF